MLRARSIALVGASPRAGSFGARMVSEVSRSTGTRAVHLINPRYDSIDGRACLPSLKHLDEPVDLVLLGVGDDKLQEQLRDAARLGARSAVVFGSAHGAGLREALRDIAIDADMALCGAGCMGFVNVADGLRATGYVEREILPAGPDRARHAFRLGVLGATAHAPRPGVHRRRLVRTGAGDDNGAVPRVRARRDRLARHRARARNGA